MPNDTKCCELLKIFAYLLLQTVCIPIFDMLGCFTDLSVLMICYFTTSDEVVVTMKAYVIFIYSVS